MAEAALKKEEEKIEDTAPAPEPKPKSKARAKVDAPSLLPTIMEIGVGVQFVLGRARMTVAELVELQRDGTIALDRRISDPIDIVVNDTLVATGELIDAEAGGLAVRVLRLTGASHG